MMATALYTGCSLVHDSRSFESLRFCACLQCENPVYAPTPPPSRVIMTELVTPTPCTQPQQSLSSPKKMKAPAKVSPPSVAAPPRRPHSRHVSRRGLGCASGALGLCGMPGAGSCGLSIDSKRRRASRAKRLVLYHATYGLRDVAAYPRQTAHACR